MVRAWALVGMPIPEIKKNKIPQMKYWFVFFIYSSCHGDGGGFCRQAQVFSSMPAGVRARAQACSRHGPACATTIFLI